MGGILFTSLQELLSNRGTSALSARRLGHIREEEPGLELRGSKAEQHCEKYQKKLV